MLLINLFFIHSFQIYFAIQFIYFSFGKIVYHVLPVGKQSFPIFTTQLRDDTSIGSWKRLKLGWDDW